MQIVLASASPRRRELMAGLGIPFTVRVPEGVDESYPQTIPVDEVAEYISKKKADSSVIADDEICIAADTIVVLGKEIMGKPHNTVHASEMLHKLSGHTHKVITGVTIKSKDYCTSFSVETKVTFKNLTDAEIDYYIENYRPLDKAGAYGVQEWIGYIGVTNLEGSYFNVMGFPIQRIYDCLSKQKIIDLFR